MKILTAKKLTSTYFRVTYTIEGKIKKEFFHKKIACLAFLGIPLTLFPKMEIYIPIVIDSY